MVRVEHREYADRCERRRRPAALSTTDTRVGLRRRAGEHHRVRHCAYPLGVLFEGTARCAMSRAALFVPGCGAPPTCSDMRRRDHLALVVDEQGSVAGLGTIEDLVRRSSGDLAEYETPALRVRREPPGPHRRRRCPRVNRELKSNPEGLVSSRSPGSPCPAEDPRAGDKRGRRRHVDRGVVGAPRVDGPHPLPAREPT
jgi:hypothetical protein